MIYLNPLGFRRISMMVTFCLVNSFTPLGVTLFHRFWNMIVAFHQLLSDNAVYMTALATPSLV